MFYLYPQLFPLMVRSTPLLYDTAAENTQCPLDSTVAPVRNPFPSVHKPNVLERDRIIGREDWYSWGNIVVLRDGFDAKAWSKAWERDLSSDAEIDSDTDDRMALEKCTCPSFRTKALKCTLLLDPTFINIQPLITVADPTSTPRQPIARTRFPCEEPRREYPSCRSHPTRHIPHSHRRIRYANHGPRRALRLVILLACNGRTCASGVGGQHASLLTVSGDTQALRV
jgi:hypothetical protein